MLFWALFFQWLDVTRASDPPVPCGHRLSKYCLTFSILMRKGTASFAAPQQKNAEHVFVSEVQSHSRDFDSMIV